jgi:U2 small nuclear ribonucleoprotein A'
VSLFFAVVRVTAHQLTLRARHPSVLNNNSLATLSSLLPLANLPKLTHLSLLGNPVRGEKYYREWVIWKVSTAFGDYVSSPVDVIAQR